MLTRFPDMPVRRHPSALEGWGSDRYVCQAKLDGWRVFVTSGPVVATRHGSEITHEVSPELLVQVDQLLGHFPRGTILDGEWCKRRSRTLDLPERLYVWDVPRLGKTWQVRVPYTSRLEQVLFGFTKAFLWTVALGEPAPLVRLPDQDTGDFPAFYEAQAKDPYSEGVVVKARSSGLVLNHRRCAKNPRWFKVLEEVPSA